MDLIIVCFSERVINLKSVISLKFRAQTEKISREKLPCGEDNLVVSHIDACNFNVSSELTCDL